jgi:hypothetical protein
MNTPSYLAVKPDQIEYHVTMQLAEHMRHRSERTVSRRMRQTARFRRDVMREIRKIGTDGKTQALAKVWAYEAVQLLDEWNHAAAVAGKKVK